MKKILIMVFVMLFYTIGTTAGENDKETLPENCYAEYKVSPSTLGCGFKKGIRRLTTNQDGTKNAFGRFFDSKTFMEIKY